MRLPIVHLATAYIIGLWSGGVLPVRVVVVGCSVAWAAVAMGRRRAWSIIVVAVACAGVVGGTIANRDRAAWCRAVWEVGEQRAIVTLDDTPGERLRTHAHIIHAAPGCAGTIIVRLDQWYPAGAVLIVAGTYRGYGVLRVVHARQVGVHGGLRRRLRAAAAARIRDLYGERSGMVEALVIGRRDDLPPAIRETFVGAGIAHLLAISGLHVGLLAGWIVMGVRLTPARRHAIVIGACCTWAYVGLLGFPASATRAAAFISVYAAARIRQRHPAALAVLSVGALAVVSIDPWAVRSVGAWLSVSAVWATSYAPRHLPLRVRRRPFARLGAASVGATLTTAPITAFVFGSAAPVGVLTNLLAIPLAGVAVPAVFASLAVGAPMAAGAGLVLTVLERVAAVASSLPGAHVTGVPGWRFALPWCAVVGMVAYLVERRPTWSRLRLQLAAACALVTWGAVGLQSWSSSRDGELELYALDVGQGDAIAVRTPGGHWLLVDGGPLTRHENAGRKTVIPFLRRRGVRQIDALIVSHGDADHLGGIPSIVSTFQPRLVLEPGQPLTTDLYREHLAQIDASGSTWMAARAGDSLVVDGVRFIVMHPSDSWINREFRVNENSVVLRVEFGCFSALLLGDAGTPVELALQDQLARVNVLKVGHHGSAGGTSTALLAAVDPAVAVISVGPNSYGHPAREVLDRLRARDVEIFRTDDDGTVTIRSDGRYLEVVNRERDHLVGRLMCRIRRWLPSSSSSSSSSGCTRGRRVSSPICSTTSHLRRR